MTIINRNFKKFFDITKLQHLYPYKSTQELELIKNYCCKRTIYYIHKLQGKSKVYANNNKGNINFPVRQTSIALKQEREQNRQYKTCYKYFISELEITKNYTMTIPIIICMHIILF